MAIIVQLDKYKDLNLLRSGYEFLRRKFNERFDAGTRLSDLSPETLFRLAEPGDESTTALNSLIIGFLGYGAVRTFESLEAQDQNNVLDIQLFLADQIHFEIMSRLGWLGSFAGNQFPLFEMVRKYEHVKNVCQTSPPKLARNHPDYQEYLGLIDRDQQVFIRRLLPSALQVFKIMNKL